MSDRVRPPTPDEAYAIQHECRRMGLKLTFDEVRKVIYATDIVYDSAARAARATDPAP